MSIKLKNFLTWTAVIGVCSIIAVAGISIDGVRHVIAMWDAPTELPALRQQISDVQTNLTGLRYDFEKYQIKTDDQFSQLQKQLDDIQNQRYRSPRQSMSDTTNAGAIVLR